MAHIHGIAGEWARVRGTVVGLWPLFLGVFDAGLSLGVCAVSTSWGLGMFCISLGCIGYSLRQGLRRTARFFVGARGEERVSGILKELPDRYHVFNDFEAGGVHVDHVVVGPAGVFAVETKYWRGRVTVEGTVEKEVLPYHGEWDERIQTDAEDGTGDGTEDGGGW